MLLGHCYWKVEDYRNSTEWFRKALERLDKSEQFKEGDKTYLQLYVKQHFENYENGLFSPEQFSAVTLRLKTQFPLIRKNRDDASL